MDEKTRAQEAANRLRERRLTQAQADYEKSVQVIDIMHERILKNIDLSDTFTQYMIERHGDDGRTEPTP